MRTRDTLFSTATAVSRYGRCLGLSILLVCLSAGFVESATITLTWDPSPESDVAGYIVSYGTTPGPYTSSIDVGGATTFEFAAPDPTQIYYLAVQAYNTAGLLSPYSNQLSTTPGVLLLTVTNLAANLPSPQLVGTTIAFTATAAGGAAPYQYEWWISDGTTSVVEKNWSTSNSFSWTPTIPGAHNTVTVWARNASSTIDDFDNPAAKLSLTFAIATAQAISFMQLACAVPQSPTATVAVTYPSMQTAGDLNIVVIGWSNAISPIRTVQDSAGNVYSLAIGPTTGTAIGQSIYYASNARGGSNTVTVVFDQLTDDPDVRILEYRGLSTADVTAGASGNSIMAESGTATTTSPDELIFGANTVATTSSNACGGFAPRILTSPDGDTVEDSIVNVVGSYSAGAALDKARPWIMQMVTFK